MSGGSALFSAFHEEDFDIGADTEPYEITSSPNWETWSVNVSTLNAAPVTGIKRMSAAQTVFTFGKVTFVLAPSEDYSTTTVYQLDSGNRAPVATVIDGYVRDFVQVQ